MSVALYGSYYAFDYIGPLAPLLSRQLHFSDSKIGLLQAVYVESLVSSYARRCTSSDQVGHFSAVS